MYVLNWHWCKLFGSLELCFQNFFYSLHTHFIIRLLCFLKSGLNSLFPLNIGILCGLFAGLQVQSPDKLLHSLWKSMNPLIPPAPPEYHYCLTARIPLFSINHES